MNPHEISDDSDAMPNFADRAIREALDDTDNLRAILRRVLRDAAELFEYAKKKPLPRDFLLPNWSGRERDYLCEIPYRVGDGERQALVCVLIEHQTQPNPRMPLRTLIYAVFYWEKCLRAWESSPSPRAVFRLPTIVPIVLHASPGRWTGPRTIADMLDEPAAFHPFAPVWKPIFWEVGEHTAQEWLASEDPFLQLMAIVRAENAERDEALAVYREMLRQFADLREQNAMRWTHLLRFALGWVVNRRPRSERSDWIQATEESQTSVLAKEEIRNMGKTIAQSWVEEGFEMGQAKGIEIGQAKGIEIGAVKTLHAMIDRIGRKRLGEPPEQVRTELLAINDVARLERLSDRVLDVASWQELLTAEPPSQ